MTFVTGPADDGQEESQRDLTLKEAIAPWLADQALLEVMDKRLVSPLVSRR